MYLFEIRRASPCRTWDERFVVEANGATVSEARARVEFSLGDSERIDAPTRDMIRIVSIREP